MGRRLRPPAHAPRDPADVEEVVLSLVDGAPDQYQHGAFVAVASDADARPPVRVESIDAIGERGCDRLGILFVVARGRACRVESNTVSCGRSSVRTRAIRPS